MEIIIGVIILSICVVFYAYLHNEIVVPALRKKKAAEAAEREKLLLEKEARLKEIEQAQIRRAAQREAEAQKALAAAQAKKQAEVAAFKEKKSQPVLRSSQLQELNASLRSSQDLLQQLLKHQNRAKENELPDVYFDQTTGQWRVRE